MATVPEIRLLIIEILKNYQTAKLDPSDDETVKVWASILDDIPFGKLEAALRKYVRDGNEYPPNSGSLAKYCDIKTREQNALTAAAAEEDRDIPWMRAECQKEREYCHSLEVPAANEYRAQGMNFDEWRCAIRASERIGGAR